MFQHFLYRRSRFRRRVLCQTLAGNACDMLTITSFNSDPEAIKQRKGVVITARVHPGETNSSFMMHGVIDYLTGPRYEFISLSLTKKNETYFIFWGVSLCESCYATRNIFYHYLHALKKGREFEKK